MSIFSKVFSFQVIIMALVVLSPINVYADVMNPDFLSKTCEPGEREVVCRFRSDEPFGPITTDECGQYKNDPNYYFIVSHGSSFGGEEKYCLKVSAQENSNQNVDEEEQNVEKQEQNISYDYLVIGGIVGAVVSLSLLALFLIRKKNVSH